MNPATKPATSIEDLPPEMICELFEYLHPKDLAACSMVNKRWHSIYAGFKVHRLVATYHVSKLYDSNQPIAVESVCNLKAFIHLVEKPLLSNLKYLALRGNDVEFDLNKLNRFQQLVHLEIRIDLDEEVRLNLPKLKVLAFHRKNHRCALSIDCPRLSTLHYDEDSNLLDLKHPETVRKLHTYMFGPRLAKFKSVECLVTENFQAISKTTLLSLPKLRELRHDQAIEWVFDEESRHGISAVDHLKRTLSEFMGEAKKLRGSDFRFTFAGLQLSKTMLDQIDFGVYVDEFGRERADNEYVYLKNYHLIEPGALQFIEKVDYILLLNSVTGEFPRCFSQKFTGIEEVHATAKVQDADHFLWFLKSLRCLESLTLESTGLSQEFYNQLPASASSLNWLELKDGHCEDDLQLNFDFIGGFSRLSRLSIDFALSVESLPSLVRSSGKFANACVNVRFREDVEIRNDSMGWMIIKDNELLFVDQNPDEVVNFIKKLQGNMSARSSSSGWAVISFNG